MIMKKVTLFFFSMVVALAFAACGSETTKPTTNTANAANAVNAAAKPAAAAPTKDALMALEKSAYEAWKTKDAKFWDPFLTENFVGFGATGRMDRAAAIKEYSGTDCDVKSYALSDDQMTTVGSDVAYITHKATYEGTCAGQKLPAQAMVFGIYVRSGDKWKGAFHGETNVVDPKAPPAKSTAPAAKMGEMKSDATTDAMLAAFKSGWEAWKNRDGKGIEAMITKNLGLIDAMGQRFDKAGAMKAWIEPKCEVKSFSLTDVSGVSLSKDAGFLTLKGTADGKCDGQTLTPLMQLAFMVKEGDAWKLAMLFEKPV
jgi:hypothetical protein